MDEESQRTLNDLNRRIFEIQQEKARLVVKHVPSELRALGTRWLERIDKMPDDWVGFGDEHEWRALSNMRDAYLSNLEILRRDEP